MFRLVVTRLKLAETRLAIAYCFQWGCRAQVTKNRRCRHGNYALENAAPDVH